ncbi:MAG TPA: DUF3119 family protein [Stenomitos sp.]
MTFSSSLDQGVVLQPSYQLPAVLVVLTVPLFFVSVWLGLPILLFAFFLGIQAATLRLHFTSTALDIYRGTTRIRTFPYQDWYHWEIYWTAVPILLYFREVRNFHFLPVLFDPTALRQCLATYCPRQTDGSA